MKSAGSNVREDQAMEVKIACALKAFLLQELG